MFRKLLVLAPVLSILSASPAFAESLWVVPTNWRLENYPGSGVTAWYTGSVCSNGNLSLPSNATEADKNRFFSMIMLAKATSRPVGIYYNVSNGSCVIQSFFLQGDK